MWNKMDLTGNRFGKLVVLERFANYKKDQTYYRCKCDCGNEVITNSSRLRNGKKTSCGCEYKSKRKFEDLTGKKFNKLKVIKLSHSKKRSDGRSVYFWECLCDCGNTTIVQSSHLKTGHTMSCGCVLEKIRENIKFVNYKNGLSQTRLAYTYNNMMNRCYREKDETYKYYGGRGIKVCNEWLRTNKDGFTNFCDWALKNGYEEKHSANGRNELTLDRIDCDKNYSPNNCRWVDIYVQANNKRNVKRFLYKGEELTLSQLSRKYNVKYDTLRNRIKLLGWDIARAIEKPVVRGQNQYYKKGANYGEKI